MADITLHSHPLFLPEADSYLTRFTIPQTYNYSVLLVDPASHTLYVGARDTIFALSLPFSGERPRRVRDKSGADLIPGHVIRSMVLWAVVCVGGVVLGGEVLVKMSEARSATSLSQPSDEGVMVAGKL